MPNNFEVHEIARQDVGSVLIIIELVYYTIWVAVLVYRWVQGRRHPTPVVEYRPQRRHYYRRRYVRKALATAAVVGHTFMLVGTVKKVVSDTGTTTIEDLDHACPPKTVAKAPTRPPGASAPPAVYTWPYGPPRAYYGPNGAYPARQNRSGRVQQLQRWYWVPLRH